MSALGDYYSYYAANDYLAHHGVLGMKWGQHIFGKDKSSGSSKRHLFETKKQRHEREEQERIAKEKQRLANSRKHHTIEKKTDTF